jgi:hypothetical protein
MLWFLAMFVFTIICLEIFARIYIGKILEKSLDPKFRFSSYRVYEHVPGFHEGKDGKDWIVINNQGFRRSTDVSVEKPANTYRIFLLGGSAAHGISSAPPYPIKHIYQHETIDAYLEKLLQSNFPNKKIEVINAAVTGYQTFQHHAYLTSELLNYNPDFIIFFDGANDHYVNNPKFDPYRDFLYQFWKTRLQEPSIGGVIDYFTLYLSQYSALAKGYFYYLLPRDADAKRRASNMVISEYGSEKELIENHKKAANKQFLRSIRNNLSLLKDYDVSALVCLQPMLPFRDTTLLSKEELSFNKKEPLKKAVYPFVTEEVKNLTHQYGYDYLDLNPVFNDQKYTHQQLLIDYCHLSAKGSEVSAQAIFEVIKTKINLRMEDNSLIK